MVKTRSKPVKCRKMVNSLHVSQCRQVMYDIYLLLVICNGYLLLVICKGYLLLVICNGYLLLVICNGNTFKGISIDVKIFPSLRTAGYS